MFKDLITKNIGEAKVLLVGIPYERSSSQYRGCRLAPNKLRELSELLPPYTMERESLKPVKIYDVGNVNLIKTDNSFDDLADNSLKFYNLNKFLVFLGGDHAISIGTEEGFFKKCFKENKIPVVFNLSAQCGLNVVHEKSLFSNETVNMRALENGVTDDNLVLFGTRSFEEEEVKFLNKRNEIKVISSKQINENINSVFEYLNKYSDEKYMIHISFDIDMIDPSSAPGVGLPEHFGVKAEKALELIQTMVKKYNVVSLDVTGVSPSIDVNDTTSWLALKILYEVFGELLKK